VSAITLPAALAELKEQRRWVCWKYETRGGNKTKVPYQPNRVNASSTDDSTWSAFDAVASAYASGGKFFDGVGFVLTDSDLAAFDLDHCRDPATGEIQTWAAELVARAASYSEVTPSGAGLRIIGRGSGGKVHRKLNKVGTNGASCEVYRKATRYITVTGIIYREAMLANIDAVVDAVVAEHDGDRTEPRSNTQATATELPPMLASLLDIVGSGAYPSRSELLFAFITGAMRSGVADDAIIAACLDSAHEGCGIFEHCRDNGGETYVKRQIEHAANKRNETSTGLRAITVKDGEIARAVDEAEDALLAAGLPIFERAGLLVMPIKSTVPAADETKTEIVLLKAVRLENIVYLLNKHAAAFRRYDKRQRRLVEIDPPHAVAAIMAAKGQWKFPRLAGVTTTPTMRVDGTLLDAPGYDPATQLWYSPDANLLLPEIKTEPTRADAEAALSLLSDLLTEFPFVGNTDRSVALAAIMTPVLRGAFDVAPMFLMLASTAGTGKTYLVNLAAVTLTGRTCPVITNVKSQEEMEKRLGSLVLEGAAVISLDNTTTDIGGDLLCQVTEQRLIRIRILGKSETPECEWRGTMFATGNNVSLVGDMTRRGLICNMDAGLERPELRQFEADPIAKVYADRGAYIAAILTIARAWHAAGMPDCAAPPIASYGAWSRAVRLPLMWLGEGDCVKSMEQAREDDPVRNAARDLFAQLREHLTVDASFTAADLIKLAEEVRQTPIDIDRPDYELVRPELNELLRTQGGTRMNRIDPTLIGNWLKSIKGQVHHGYQLVPAREKGHRGKPYMLKARG
jgi:putative DNA primase/helicase